MLGRRPILMFVLSALMAIPTSGRAQQPLSLEDCIARAMDQSTQVGISRENLKSARSSVLQNYASFLPNAQASLYAGHTFIGPSATVSFDTQGRPVQPEGFDYESYNFQINGGMNVFDWGANISTLNQSRHSERASGHDLEYQKDFIKAAVIREYYDYLRRIKLREVQEDDVKANERNLEQVEAFYRIGSRTKADFLQAQVNLATSQLNLLNAKNAEELARASLASRMNMPLEAEISIQEDYEVQPFEVDLSAEVEYMNGHRSDLLASRSRMAAAKSGLTAAENSRWPSLSANYSFGWNDREFADNANFFQTDYNWGVGVALSYDIFDRFVTKSNIQNARASERIAELNLKQAKLDALLDLKGIVLNLNQARERLTITEASVNYATENLRLAQERYRVGAGTILETIQASASLTQAQGSLVEAQIDFLIYKADLQRATGRPVRTN